MAKSSKKRKPWFKATRGSYIFNTWQGALLYVPFIAYLVFAWVVVDKHQGSIAYKLFEVFAFWIVGLIVMTWLAKRLSR